MSAFGGLVLTNRGKILQSKAQAGVQLKYTRIALGDGNLGTTSILELNALRHEVKSLSITKLKVFGDGRATVGTVLRPQDVTSGFYFREIGVFATDPDVGEVLYCYGNAGNLAEYIPAGGVDTIEKTIDIQTLIGNATNVTAELDSLIFESPEGAQEKANQAETNAKSYADTKFALAETPAGAQAKVNLAISNLVNAAPGTLDTLNEIAIALANDPNFATTILNRLATDELDLSTHKNDNVKHITSVERTSWNAKETTAGALAKVEQDSYKTSKTNKDSNGIYTTVEHRRKSDNTLVRRSVLSGGTSPQYTTRTVTFFGTDGTTTVDTKTFAITYDSDGDMISEV